MTKHETMGGPRAVGAWLRRLGAATLLALAVAGCGGGGGGGDGGGGSSFNVTLNRSAIELSLDAGGSPPVTQVRATATGTPPGTLYVAAQVEGVGIDPAILGVISGMEATFTMQPAPGLEPGVYTGRVLLLACSDAACTHRIGGTPLAVNYTVTVRAVLRTTPSSVADVLVGGNTAQQRVRVGLPPGASSFSLAGTDALPWVRTRIEGNEIVIDFLPWRAGAYSGVIEVVAGGNRVPLAVDYQVLLPSGGERDLAVAPGALTISTTEGARSDARSVAVTPASWSGGTQPVASVRYPAGAPTGWLQVTPGSDGVSVLADAAALGQGSYSATLVFTPAAPATVVELPVALSVGPGLVRPADWPVAVFAETAAAALEGQAAVQVAQGPDVAWTATSSQPWLRLTNAAGTTGSGAVAWAIEPAALAALANFQEHVATITLRATSSVYTPVSFDVRVDKRLPEVQVLGPSSVVAGRSSTLTVRGRGFTAVADIAARFAAAGLPVSGLTRVSDSELQMQVTPTAAGSVPVTVDNALGLAPAAATLAVLPARSHAYATVASGGAKRALVVDAARQAVYAVNVENETLNRFRFDGSNWVLDAVSIPSILDAGLAPDGAHLIVSATPGRVRLLDAASLDTVFSLDVPGGLARNLTYVGHGISSTNDGQSWLPAGEGSWNELIRFDHATRTLQPRPAQPDLRTSFYGGPWTMVSRDGGTMLVVQSGSITPSPPALVWRSRDPLLRATGTELTFLYEASWSDDGSRVSIDAYEVRDANLGLVGTTRLDGLAGGPWVSMLGAVSPDGSRTYVLAYPESAFNGGPGLPRVWVFDSRTRDPASSVLPVLGHIELADFPGCRTFSSGDCPTVRPRMVIAPDGQTLFVAGNERFIVVPVPESLRGSGGVLSAPRARAQGTAPRTWRWR